MKKPGSQIAATVINGRTDKTMIAEQIASDRSAAEARALFTQIRDVGERHNAQIGQCEKNLVAALEQVSTSRRAIDEARRRKVTELAPLQQRHAALVKD